MASQTVDSENKTLTFESSQDDSIVFASEMGINSDTPLTYTKNDNNLIISGYDGNNTITIENFNFSSTGNNTNSITFSDKEDIKISDQLIDITVPTGDIHKSGAYKERITLGGADISLTIGSESPNLSYARTNNSNDVTITGGDREVVIKDFFVANNPNIVGSLKINSDDPINSSIKVNVSLSNEISTYNSTVFAEEISLKAGANVNVSGLTESDIIKLDSPVLNRYCDGINADLKNQLEITGSAIGGNVAITVADFFTNTNGLSNIRTRSTTSAITTYNLNVILSNNATYTAEADFKQTIKGSGTVVASSLKTTGDKIDDIFVGSENSTVTLNRLNNSSDVEIVGSGENATTITVQGFFNLNGYIKVNGNILSNSTAINVTLDDEFSGNTYSCITNYAENITTNVSCTISNLTKGSDTLTIQDGNGIKTYSQTLDNNDLTVVSTNSSNPEAPISTTVVIKDFFENDKLNTLTIDNNSSPIDMLNLTLIPSASVNAQEYNYNLNCSLLNGIASIYNLKSNDNIQLSDASLSRIWDNANKNTLSLSNASAKINITDYFEGNNNNGTLNGSSLPNDLTVILNDNVNTYSATSFNEKISGAGKVDLSSSNLDLTTQDSDYLFINNGLSATYHRTNTGNLVVSGGDDSITVIGFDFTNATKNIYVNNTSTSTSATRIATTLNDGNSYIATKYIDDITVLASCTISNLTKGVDTLTIHEGDGVKTYSRTASSSNLRIESTKDSIATIVTLVDFFSGLNDETPELTIDNSSEPIDSLNVSLDYGSYQATRYNEILSLAQGQNSVNVSKLNSGDRINFNNATLSRTYNSATSTNNNNLTIEDTINHTAIIVQDFFANTNTFDNLNGHSIKSTDTINVTLLGDNTIYNADTNYKEAISGKGTVNSLSNNDYIAIQKSNAKYYRTNNDTVLEIKDITNNTNDIKISNYNFTNENTSIHIGGLEENNLIKTTDTINVSLSNNTTYITTDYIEIIDGVGHVSNLSSDDKIKTEVDTLTRNYDGNNNSKLTIGNITVDDFFENTNNCAQFENGVLISSKTLDVILSNSQTYTAEADFKQTIKGFGTVVASSLKTTGDKIDDIFVGSENSTVTLNRLNNSSDVEIVGSGENATTITVQGFFNLTPNDANNDYIKVNGNKLSNLTVINVEATQDYVAINDYTQYLTVKGNINISGLSITSDKVIVEDASIFTRDYTDSPNTLKISGGSCTAKITDYFTVGDNTLTINDGLNDIVKSNQTLNVSGLNTPDSQSTIDCSSLGFKNYIITANASNDTIIGGDNSDTIKGGLGTDIIAAGKGNDNIYGGNGIESDNSTDTFIFKSGDGKDTIYDAQNNDIIQIDTIVPSPETTLQFNFDKINSKLIITGYGNTEEDNLDSITVNYDFNNPINNIDTVKVKTDNDTYQTLSIKDFHMFDVELNGNTLDKTSGNPFYGKRVNVSGYGTVIGLNDKDTITTTTDLKLSRTYNSATSTNNNNLTIEDTINHTAIIVQDFFTNTNTFDNLNGHSIKSTDTIYVTLSGDNTTYSTEPNYKEAISGKGTVSADNLITQDSDYLLINNGQSATYHRTNTGNLVVSGGDDSITVTDFDFTNATKNIYVNNTSTSTSTEINTVINGISTYNATPYVNNITVGSNCTIIGLAKGRDSLTIDSEDVAEYNRTAGSDSLTIKKGSIEITLPSFFEESLSNLEILGIDGSEGMTLNVSLDSDYFGTRYREILSLAQNQSSANVSNLTSEDKINFPDAVLSRLYNGEDNDKLIIKNTSTDKSIIITDFFNSTPTISTHINSLNDTTIANSIIYTTISGDNITYIPIADYKEAIDGKASVDYSTLSPDNHFIRINNAKYYRMGSNDDTTLEIKDSLNSNDIKIINFAFETVNSNVKVGTAQEDAHLITSGDNGITLNVSLLGYGSAIYAATDYKEIFTGSGTISSISANDSVIFSGEIGDALTCSGDSLEISGGNTIIISDYFTNADARSNIYKENSTSEALLTSRHLNISNRSEYNNNVFGFASVSIGGTAGSDTYIASSASDTIEAGKGSDTITGNGGSDIFIFNNGDGDDIITDASSDDIIKFNGYTDFNGIIFDKVGADLKITYNTNDTITINNYFTTADGNTVSSDTVKTFKLGDNLYTLAWKQSNVDNGWSMYNIANDTDSMVSGIKNWLNTGSDDDNIIGVSQGDMLAGNDGKDNILSNYGGSEFYGGIENDNIEAYNGGNFVVGGRGEDIISVSGGNNTICFVNASDAGYEKAFGVDTLSGAISTDTLKFSLSNGTGYKFSELKFDRQSNDLIISDINNSENSVKIVGFFTSLSKVDKLLALNENNVQTEYSILDNAKINVNLNQGSPYSATEYNEIITGSGVVSGLTNKDKINLADYVLSRTYNSTVTTENNYLTIKGENGDTIVVTDFFSNTCTFDNLNGNSIKSNDTIAVTLSGDNTTYFALADYKESIKGVGMVFNMSDTDYIDIAKTNATYYRTGVDNILEIKDNLGNDIKVNYNFANENQVRIGGLEGDNFVKYTDTINVDLNDTVYLATNYKEVITGSGSVFGLGANDKIDIAPIELSRIWDDDNNRNTLVIKDNASTINILDFFINNSFNTLADGDIKNNNRTLNVTLMSEEAYIPGNNFNEVISGNGVAEKITDNATLLFDSETSYSLDASGLSINGGNIIKIGDYTYTANNLPKNIYIGAFEEDISSKTLVVTDLSEFNGEELGFKNYRITATDGDDYLSGGNGDDIITGGDGADIFVFNSNSAADILTDATAEDTIKFTDVAWKDLKFIKEDTSLIIKHGETGSVEIKNYYTKEGTVLENNVADTVYTSDSDNPYSLSKKDAILSKKSYYNNSVDFTEEILGAENDDKLTATGKNNIWIEGAEGDDIIKGGNRYNVLIGDDGDDNIIGGNGINEIYGGNGNDIITGGKSNDIIHGGNYSDYFAIEGSGNDTINAGMGNDIIVSGDGDDIITGGKGADTFVFTLNTNTGNSFGYNEITDATNEDIIQLRLVDYTNENYPKLKNAGKLTLSPTGDIVSSDVEFSGRKSGDDLIITASHLTDDDSSNVTGEIQLDNFFKKASSKNIDKIDLGVDKETGKPIIYSILENLSIDVEFPTNSTNYTGSNYNESIIVRQDSTLKMGNGNNTVTFASGYRGYTSITLTSGERTNLVFDNSVDMDSLECSKSSNGKDLLIAMSNGSTIAIKNYMAKEADAIVKINGKDLYNIFDDFQFNKDDVNGKKNLLVTTNTSDDIDVSDYKSINSKGVNINSKAGNDVILGSAFNDTIKSSSGDNQIIELYGNNKLTTGKGNDNFIVDNYSSNNIKSKGGNNTLKLYSAGRNTATFGNGNDKILITNGNNSVKAGNGLNYISVGDITTTSSSTNKITTGSGVDTIDIFGGTNTINSSGGNDIINLYEGNNTVKSLKGDNRILVDYNEATDNGTMSNKIVTGKGIDNIIIKNGYNIVDSGKGNDILEITSAIKSDDTLTTSYNIVNAGIGNDKFIISAGQNIIDGGKGNDTYIVKDGGLDTKIKDSQGNDTYDFSNVSTFDTVVSIADTKGKNTIILDELKEFYFDVSIGKKGKTVIGNKIVFSSDIESSNEIEITGRKAIATIKVETSEGEFESYKFDSSAINQIAQNVAGWLKESGYKSTAQVFSNPKDSDDIATLLGYYSGNDDAYIQK